MKKAPKIWDVVVVGGGLAGLTSAYFLRERGHAVLLIEKKGLPRHKVCGEYLSLEALPILKEMGVNMYGFPKVKRLILSAANGKAIETKLPLGGVGVSRKYLDHRMYSACQKKGVEVLLDTSVKNCLRGEDDFLIKCADGKEYHARHVIMATGKSPMSGKEVQGKRYLGMKQYYKLPFKDDLVVLHNFKGGYGGAVLVEDGTVDVAYMVEEEVFKKYKNIGELEKAILHKNPMLREIMTKGKPVLNRTMAISNFGLGKKSLVEQGVYFVGDSAAMIPPATGNGMAMSIISGQALAGIVSDVLKGKSTPQAGERKYKDAWSRKLSRRMTFGSAIQSIMGMHLISGVLLFIFQVFPGLLTWIIKKTHG